MSEAYIGEIRLVSFDYAPEGWLLCAGQLLSVQQYQALFTLIGKTYGGDGENTFCLPDLRGRTVTQCGYGPQVGWALGQEGGTSSEEIDASTAFMVNSWMQLPAHNHSATFTPSGGGATVQPTITMNISSDAATSAKPLANGYLAGLKMSGLGALPNAYVGTATTGTTALNTNAATATGGSGGTMTAGFVSLTPTGSVRPQSVPVPLSVTVPARMPPFVAMNYIICATDGYYPPRPNDSAA
jgi:microcystin-dependent protein